MGFFFFQFWKELCPLLVVLLPPYCVLPCADATPVIGLQDQNPALNLNILLVAMSDIILSLPSFKK